MFHGVYDLSVLDSLAGSETWEMPAHNAFVNQRSCESDLSTTSLAEHFSSAAILYIASFASGCCSDLAIWTFLPMLFLVVRGAYRLVD